jgi:RNA polymerase sigma factor (sigma-70 family)
MVGQFMTDFPDTRASLILRIGSAEDAQAWEEFLRLYQPVVYRLARRQGLQHVDAEELVQEVMLRVARNVEDFDPNPERGRFRSWLFRIARNLIVNYLTRRKFQTLGTGLLGVQSLLEQQNGRESSLSQLIEIEFRRCRFEHAARLVRSAVTEKTWNAFWLSAVDELPIARVAMQLGMTVGAVSVARIRVVARMRAEVQRLEREELNA